MWLKLYKYNVQVFALNAESSTFAIGIDLHIPSKFIIVNKKSQGFTPVSHVWR